LLIAAQPLSLDDLASLQSLLKSEFLQILHETHRMTSEKAFSAQDIKSTSRISLGKVVVIFAYGEKWFCKDIFR
jgi:hypothetical protein